MSLPVLLIVIVPGLYCLVILMLVLGLRRLKASPETSAVPATAVSLLIPFHNEKEVLPALVSDLLAQDYPGEQFQVIFIDDHSEDGSGELCDRLIENCSNFECVKQAEGRRGKKAALVRGLREVETEWVLQTDADCRLEPCFLKERMVFAEKHPADLIAGPVKTAAQNPTFLSRFEELDLLSLVAAGAGSYSFGRAQMCNGANLLYKKELHDATRRFDPGGIASGDDMFLMIGARKLGKKLGYHASPGVTVRTSSIPSWKALFRQRMRWGGKSTSYGMPDIQAFALLVVLANLAFLAAPVMVILVHGSWPVVAGILVLSTGVNHALLKGMAERTGQRKAMRFFPPVALIYPFYLIILAFGSLVPRPGQASQW